MKSLLSFCTLTVIMAGAACNKAIESPSAPSPVNPLDTRRVIAFDVRCPDEGEGLQCWAWAGFSDQTAQEVSGLATWSTSESSIATVNSTGLVTAQRTGEVAIRAAFQGVQAFATVWAEPGQGLRGTNRLLNGSVISLAGGGVEGVLMQVIDGGPVDHDVRERRVPDGRPQGRSTRDPLFQDRLRDWHRELVHTRR